MERSIPGMAQLTRRTSGPVRDKIRSMPDFVVQDPRNNKLHFRRGEVPGQRCLQHR
jgi:hypothetical protein